MSRPNYLGPPISPERHSLMLSDSILGMVLGDKKMLSSQKLVNPFKLGMYVREIRFDIGFGCTLPPPNPNAPGYGDVWVKLDLGRNPITNGFIPLWLLGKTLSPFDEAVTWRFKRPVYIPSREYIVPTLYYAQNANGNGLEALTSARITVIGTSCSPDDSVPSYIDLPYATAFVGNSIDVVSNTVADNLIETTNESQLVNSLQVPLEIERFSGRIGGSVGDYTINNSILAGPNKFQVASTLASNTLVRMVSHEGQMAVRDNTPFGLLFSAPEHAWVVDAQLPPKGFFIATFTENWKQTLTNSTYAQVQVAMIGNRRVAMV